MLDLVARFREFAGRTQDELLDVHTEFVLQHARLVGAVHDTTLRVVIVRRLRTQFTAEEFGNFTRRAM